MANRARVDPLKAERVTVRLFSALLLYGAFSRFTHGAYTPDWYAFQTDRAPDDGTFRARLIPFVDATLAVMLLLPERSVNLMSISICWAFFMMGTIARAFERGPWEAKEDALLTLLASSALWAARRRWTG